MSTVVVLNLASSGHINPTLPLVTELVDRGERVVYYSIEQYRACIEQTGAEYRSYSHPESLKPKFHHGGHLGVMAYFAAAAQLNLPALLEEIKAIDPDYILLDSMCLLGNYVHQITGIPCITFSSIFVMHPKLEADAILEMSYGSLPSSVALQGIQALHRYLQITQDIDREFGCKSPGLIEAFSNQHGLNLLFTSKMLHPMPHLFDDSMYKFVGPSFAPRKENLDFPFEELHAEKVIYISLGTIVDHGAAFYQDCFEAFGNRSDRPYPHQVILSTGNKVDPATLGPIPDNFIVRSFVPQLEILQRTSVFISHGGMNSTGEALYHGVPLIVIPQRGDAYLVKEQVSRNGAGIGMLPEQASPQALFDAVETVLSTPSYTANAAKIQESFLAGGGYRSAVDAIMHYKEKILLTTSIS